jgi:hypothetical protein
VQAHLHAGDIDMAKATSVLQTLPTDPADFPKWRASMLRGIMAAKDAYEAGKPLIQNVDAGGTHKTFGIDPDTMQPVGAAISTPITVSANTVATQAGEDRRAKASRDIEIVKADPFGVLGLNKNAPAGVQGTAGPSGDAYLQTLAPGIASQVKALAEGKIQFTPRTLQSPQGAALLQMAMQYEPGTDQTTYLQRAQTVKDFAPGGKDGSSITNLNTALHHAGQLSDAITNLNNSNVLPGIVNPVENLIGQKLAGSSVQGVYKQKADALSAELRKVYAGSGGGTLHELQSWQSSFDPNASRDQQRAYLQGGMELLVGALQSKQEAYQRGMGSRADFGQFITPESQKILQRLAPDYAGQIAGGAAPAVPTPSAAPAPGASPASLGDAVAAELAKRGH